MPAPGATPGWTPMTEYRPLQASGLEPQRLSGLHLVLTEHLQTAFRLHDAIARLIDDIPGETAQVLIEGALRGVEEGVCQRLLYVVEARIAQARREGAPGSAPPRCPTPETPCDD
jgi:hypothetical protein